MDGTRRTLLEDGDDGGRSRRDAPARGAPWDHARTRRHQAVPSDLTLRVKSLESLLVDKGLVDPAGARCGDRHHGTQGRPAERRARGRARLGRPGLQEASARRRAGGDRRAGVHERPGRTHGRGREHPGGAQPDRLHLVLLLPVAGPRSAAGLVQVGALPVARGHRSARPAGRVRHAPAGGRGGPRLGQHRGAALHRAARASGRKRRAERRGTGRARHARRDGRRRARSRCRRREAGHERRPRHGRAARHGRRRTTNGTSRSSTKRGRGASGRSAGRWARGASGTSTSAGTRSRGCRRPTTSA